LAIDIEDFPVVRVEWIDSVQEHGWSYLEESLKKSNDEAMECVSVGFLVKETDNFIVLAESFMMASSSVSGFMQIPKVAVDKIDTFQVSGVRAFSVANATT
jgi:hypothetical protein